MNRNWRLKEDVLTMAVGIPPNTTATVHVPTRDVKLVKESGIAPDKAPGVKFLRIEQGAAVYEVGSGRYIFTSPVKVKSYGLSVIRMRLVLREYFTAKPQRSGSGFFPVKTLKWIGAG